MAASRNDHFWWRSNIRIWRSEKPVAVVETERACFRRAFGPFFFAEKSVNGTGASGKDTKLTDLTSRRTGGVESIFQQDGPHHIGMWVSRYTALGTYLVDGLAAHQLQTSANGHRGHRTWQCVIPSFAASSRTMLIPPFRTRVRNWQDASIVAWRISQKAGLSGLGENGSTAETVTASHVVRTSNAFQIVENLRHSSFRCQ
jgi:hypothetical protein